MESYLNQAGEVVKISYILNMLQRGRGPFI
jgi:hypothetical protein